MVYKEISAVHLGYYSRSINTICWKYAEFYNVKAGGTYSNHCTFKDERLRDHQFK
jgi:hypothetical protein